VARDQGRLFRAGPGEPGGPGPAAVAAAVVTRCRVTSVHRVWHLGWQYRVVPDGGPTTAAGRGPRPRPLALQPGPAGGPADSDPGRGRTLEPGPPPVPGLRRRGSGQPEPGTRESGGGCSTVGHSVTFRFGQRASRRHGAAADFDH
jgi:hypothetical protein